MPSEAEESSPIVRPPIGLIPARYIKGYLDRRDEILLAMGRYSQANKAVPSDWVEELSHLITILES